MSKTNVQVAHIWAQGNNESARGSHFYCEQNRLYSYYTLVGCIIDGQVFLSESSMTPSTAKQLSHARRAVSYHYFTTPFFRYGSGSARPTPAELILPAVDSLLELFKSLPRKRANLESSINHYEARRQQILEVAARFNVTLPEIPEASGDLKAKAKELTRKEEDRRGEQARKEAERQEAQRIEDAAQFETWLTTGAGQCPRSYGTDGTDYITIRENTVITSQGAEAPLDHVKRAIKFYLSRKCTTLRPEETIFEAYQTNGHKIPLGHFTLDSIDEQGNVKAGCHRFTSQEISRFINQWREVLG